MEMNWKIINVMLLLVIIMICSFIAYGICYTNGEEETTEDNWISEATKEMKKGYYGTVTISKLPDGSYYVFIGACNDTALTSFAFNMEINTSDEGIFFSKTYFDENSWSGFNFSNDEDFYLYDLDYLTINYEKDLRVIWAGNDSTIS